MSVCILMMSVALRMSIGQSHVLIQSKQKDSHTMMKAALSSSSVAESSMSKKVIAAAGYSAFLAPSHV